MTAVYSDTDKLLCGLEAYTERLVCTHLRLLGADEVESDLVAREIRIRISKVEPVFPRKGSDEFYESYANLLCLAVTAAQRLFAARYGHIPGQLLSDWPPVLNDCEHPILTAMQNLVSELEAEANAAENGRRLN